MPSPIAHCSLIALLAPLDQRGLLPDALRRHRAPLAALLLFALVLPDIDFAIGWVAEGSALGTHAAAMHSFVMTAAAALVLAAGWWLVFRGGFRTVLLLVLAAVWSHILLDALTHGGPGPALLWPFTDQRLGAPVRVFYGVRHSQPGAWHLHLVTLVTELAFAAAVWWGSRWLAGRGPSRSRARGESGEAVEA